MSERLLDIQNLSVTFGGLNALSDLDFHVDKGEIVSVIGPNGAGKTTFFNMISGMVTPTSGDIVFKGGRCSVSTPTKSPPEASPGPFRTSACLPT